MVYKFTFSIAHNKTFQCNLESLRCSGINCDGGRCKRKVLIGTSYCFTHVQKELHLKVAKSTVADAGKGLFAIDKTKADNETIFKKGNKIIEYVGEVINLRELERRYNDKTGPYALLAGKGRYVDCACERGVASIINTNTVANKYNCRIGNPHNGRVSIFATKNIKNNQELFMSYGRQYKLHEPDVSYTTK